MGSGYVLEHCKSALRRDNEEKLFRVYVTDTLRMVTENTARLSQGSYLKVRFWDMIAPQDTREEEPAEEIIARMLAHFGSKGGEEP